MFFFFFNFHLENIFFGPIFNRCFLNGGLLAKKLMEIVKRKEGGNPHPPNGILCDWYFWTHSLDREKIENATQYSHSISFKSQGVRFPVSFVLQQGLYFNCLDCWLVGWYLKRPTRILCFCFSAQLSSQNSDVLWLETAFMLCMVAILFSLCPTNYFWKLFLQVCSWRRLRRKLR